MDLNTLQSVNPQLFWSGVGNGSIPYSSAPGNLTWGAAVSSTLVEGILGGPHGPDYQSIAVPADFASPSAFAESGRYPKPWRSAAQKLQNASYTNVGPYAALIGVGGESLCCSSDDPGKISRVYGRWGTSTSGPNIGQGAFFPQDWYNPSEGFYNATYWNDQFSPDPEWQLRVDWWESIEKVTIQSRIANTGVECEIEVAISPFVFGSDEYFAGIDLGVYADFSLDLLVAMVAIAAAVRWL